MTTQFDKPKRKKILLLSLIAFLVGIGISFKLKKTPVQPIDKQISVAIKKVVLRKFVCNKPPFGFANTRSYLKMTVYAGYERIRPMWWGHYAADLRFENIYLVDKDNFANYLGSCSGDSHYDISSELYSRTCDIPLYDGSSYVNKRWESGYADVDWEKGGTLKATINFSGGGWLSDSEGNLVRDSQSNAIFVGFNKKFPYKATIKAH